MYPQIGTTLKYPKGWASYNVTALINHASHVLFKGITFSSRVYDSCLTKKKQQKTKTNTPL